MVLARGLCRTRDFSAKRNLEHSEPLALFGVDAQHPGCGARRATLAVSVFHAADPSSASADGADLDRRSRCALVFKTVKQLPVAWLVLSGCLHGVRGFERKELLPRADLSHAVFRGRRRR